MESNLTNTTAYPSAHTMGASTLRPIKRKRDSIDDGQSNERSTSRMNPVQYNMAHTNGEAFNESFFNLDQLAAASSMPREQHNSVRTAAVEAQMAEVGRSLGTNHTNNAFASPSLPVAQLDGYPSPPVAAVAAENHTSADVGGAAAAATATGVEEPDEINDTQQDDAAISPGGTKKPIVGTDEWHKARKMSHKEVERRRRSTINDAITALAALLPKPAPRSPTQFNNTTSSSSNPRNRASAAAPPITTLPTTTSSSEKNKGAILASAVSYIRTLRDERDTSINKWTFEKMVTDEAIRTLEGRLERMAKVAEGWKRVAREAGVDVEDVEVAVRVYQGVSGDVGVGVGVGVGKDKVGGGGGPGSAVVAAAEKIGTMGMARGEEVMERERERERVE